jgi:hypothetical protein
MASNFWTASTAAARTAAPRQTRRAVGFASLGGSAIAGASFRWKIALFRRKVACFRWNSGGRLADARSMAALWQRTAP